MEKIAIKPIQETDIQQIVGMQKENNLGQWQEQDYFEEIRRKDSISFTAKKDEKVIGFIVSRLITYDNQFKNRRDSNNLVLESESEIEIYNLAVEKKSRKEGIGTLLIKKVVKAGIKNHINSIWLEVRASNSEAVEFYKKNNFVKIYRRKNFYNHPMEDGLVMKLDIFSDFKSPEK